MYLFIFIVWSFFFFLSLCSVQKWSWLVLIGCSISLSQKPDLDGIERLITVQCMKPSLFRLAFDRFSLTSIFGPILASEFSTARITSPYHRRPDFSTILSTLYRGCAHFRCKHGELRHWPNGIFSSSLVRGAVHWFL